MLSSLPKSGEACSNSTDHITSITPIIRAKTEDGVSNVKVHFASSRIEVDHDPSRQSVDDLVAAVAKAGYKAKASAF